MVNVTVPEGVTLRRIAAIMANAGVCAEDEFLAAAADPGILSAYKINANDLSGYLFPDTYRFPLGFPANLAVQTMADTFFTRLKTITGGRDYTAGEVFERVTLASIVEREYRAADEAPIMAGIFLNRLKNGIKLESCATVEYIITEIQGKAHPERLLYTDLAIDNPYNSYLYKGIPPGPISAPGSVALNAAFNPVDSDYLFFRLVNPAEGRHYFSKTFDEHIFAAEIYLKSR
jgi:UPF0755 protein